MHNSLMNRRIFIFSIILLSISCNRNSESTTQTGKSRSELLKEIPYRGEIISDGITESITQTIRLVIEQTETLNEVAIFYMVEHGKLERLTGNWENGIIALNQANELWRDIDLTMSIVVYPSFSQDAVTGETKELWVIEVDHKSVSRTCRMFIDKPTPNELTELTC
ncbi:hypothetical protein [Fulvivirga lutimaris]|uniref:hypothetical protein n=1 Tax=Fulvivirga lutimaris TaxID=1819566 RepID=UPI0012BD56A1|nr:hypothetical protein [Fulvivirga lutimaris]MTI40271.1 hypothetical protein [Fulvivirga lutimaris]